MKKNKCINDLRSIRFVEIIVTAIVFILGISGVLSLFAQNIKVLFVSAAIMGAVFLVMILPTLRGRFKLHEDHIVFCRRLAKLEINYQSIKKIEWEPYLYHVDDWIRISEKLTIITDECIYTLYEPTHLKVFSVNGVVDETTLGDAKLIKLKKALEERTVGMSREKAVKNKTEDTFFTETNTENKMMKREFENMSPIFTALKISVIAGIFMVPFFSGIGIIMLVIFGPLVYAVKEIPSSFKADKNGVTFNVVFFRKRIPYSEINKIEIERKPLETKYGTDHIETIRFFCEDGTHTYIRRMYIDKEAENDPKELKKCFENSRFAKLKEYIEENLKVVNEMKNKSAEGNDTYITAPINIDHEMPAFADMNDIFAEPKNEKLAESFKPNYKSAERSNGKFRRRLAFLLVALNWAGCYLSCKFCVYAPLLVTLALSALGCVAWWLFENVMTSSSYEADDKTVVICHYFRKVRIDYDKIRGICVQQFSRSMIGSVSYIERISIVTDYNMYVYDDIVYTDHNSQSADLESMQEKFGNAPLLKLRDHIIRIRSRFISGNMIETDPERLALRKIS